MKRHNQILIGVLVVQIILSVVVFWPKSSGAVGNEPLFPDLEGGDVVALTVVDADGNSITLRRVSGNWVLPDADDYPVQEDKITPVLEKIAGLTTARLVTRTDASHKRLQVAQNDFVRRVEFETDDGEQHTLYLGSSPSYGATHFRIDQQNETYQTSDLTAWDVDTTANSWIDTAYLNVQQADITKMALENANGVFVFTRDEEGNWTMEGLAEDETLAETRVTAAIQQASFLNVTTPLGKEEQTVYGMDEPNAIATIETAAKTITLRVGAQDSDDNSYVVISSESPYYVQVSEYSVQSLVQNTRTDFIEAPPTPTPGE
ncbi:MAG: DUF4340 domain-containing protein [Chloroflexota bacterium]|nr:DUF4340 domain-containing protein [Chloroflexota bacterium]